MSLDNIHLPTFIIHDLFKYCLVDLKSYEPNLVPNTSGIHYLGNNQQHVAIVISNEEASFLTDDQLIFLTGILSACKLNMADIALLNLYKTPAINYLKINETFSPRVTILFGVTPTAIELPFNVPVFQVQSFNGQMYLPAPSLSELQLSTDQKKHLWLRLQQLFLN